MAADHYLSGRALGYVLLPLRGALSRLGGTIAGNDRDTFLSLDEAGVEELPSDGQADSPGVLGGIVVRQVGAGYDGGEASDDGELLDETETAEIVAVVGTVGVVLKDGTEGKEGVALEPDGEDAGEVIDGDEAGCDVLV